MSRKKLYKVTEIIKSPYGIFAIPGDLIHISYGMATNTHNTSMALPEYKKCTLKYSLMDMAKGRIKMIFAKKGEFTCQ